MTNPTAATAAATSSAHSIIPIQISKQRKFDAFWGQMAHFQRLRRLITSSAYDFTTSRNTTTATKTNATGTRTFHKSSSSSYHHMSWRSLSVNDDDGDSHTVTLSNCHQILYSGEIGLGSPDMQTFRVDFDTGSSDLWVVSALCDDTCDAYDNLTKYDATLSSTYEIQPTSFRIDYADGEWVDGHHAKDTLTWAGYKVPDTVFAQAFHLGDYEMCVSEDGVFGLAFSSLTSHNLTSPVSHVIDANVLPHNMFALYLDPRDNYDNSDKLIEDGTTSKLIVGGVDTDLFDGCIVWHDVKKALSSNGEVLGYWDFELKNVHTMTNKDEVYPLNFNSEDNIGILDSGSTFIVGPLHSINEYLEKINATCYVYTFSYYEYDDDGATISEIDCEAYEGWDIAGVGKFL